MSSIYRILCWIGKYHGNYTHHWKLIIVNIIYYRANQQKKDDIDLLKRAQDAFDKATKAVEQGDNTLKEASNTYQTLAGKIA